MEPAETRSPSHLFVSRRYISPVARRPDANGSMNHKIGHPRSYHRGAQLKTLRDQRLFLCRFTVLT